MQVTRGEPLWQKEKRGEKRELKLARILHYIIYIFQYEILRRCITALWSTPQTSKQRTEWLILTLRINDLVPPLNDIEVVYIFCIIQDSLNTNFGPRGWIPMFPRQVDMKCQEETRTFKGQATGNSLWVGFCCVHWQLSVRACCLLQSLQFPNARKIKSGHSVNLEVDTSAASRLKILSLSQGFMK